MRRKSILTLLCVMLLVLLAGCQKEEEIVSELPAIEVESELVSEEIVSENIIEDTEPEVEIVNLDATDVRPIDALLEYVNTLNKTVIFDWDVEGMEITNIPNGAYYIVEEDEYGFDLEITSSVKKISEVKTTVNYVSFDVGYDNIWEMEIVTVGTDVEVPFTVVYEDGTEEDFTIYVTTGEDVPFPQEVEILNFEDSGDFFAYLRSFRQTIIVDYDFGATVETIEQAIIPNNAKYTLKASDLGFGDDPIYYGINVVPNGRTIKSIAANVDYISIDEWSNNTWFIEIETVGTDLEVSFTVNYEDGTSEDFTIYVTTVE